MSYCSGQPGRGPKPGPQEGNAQKISCSIGVNLYICAKKMKRLILVLLMFGSGAVNAQEWLPDLGTGLERSKREGKKVLLLFSVAEGCQICSNLEQKVFADPEFRQYALKNLILVREDFSEGTPEAKIEHLAIVEKYNRDGFFPLVLILDSAGRVLKKTGPYEGEDAAQYIRMLEKP